MYEDLIKLYGAIALLILAIVVMVVPSIHTVNKDICVKNKDMILSGAGQTLRREKIVFATDDVYDVEDDWFVGQTRSLTLYNDIENNTCYNFKVNGYRIGLLGMRQNIIKINSKGEQND